MSITIYDSLNFPSSGFQDGVCAYTPGQATGIACWAPGAQSGSLNEPLWPWLSVSFTTPATTPVVLSRVGIKLAAWDTTFNGTCAVTLVANNPNQAQGAGYILYPEIPPAPVGTPQYPIGPAGVGPGLPLIDLGSVSDTALQLAPNSENFYFYSNYVLQPSTRYWIGVRDISPPGSITGAILGWIDWPIVQASVGVAGEFYWNVAGSAVNSGLTPPEYWGIWPNNLQGPYQLQIDIN